MSSAVITSAAQGRFFVFEDESAPVCVPARDSNVIQNTVAHPERRRPSAGAKVCPELAEGELPRKDSRCEAFPRIPITTQKSAILSAVVPASRLSLRPTPDMASSGIAALDALTGGLPRGCLTEICGPASSGRTTLLLSALAAATQRSECVAIVDAGDALDPYSLAAAGVDFERLLWVRCGDASPRKENSPRSHGVTEEKNLPRHPERRRSARPPVLSRGRAERAGAKDFPLHEAPPPEKNDVHALEQLLRATDLLLESGGFGLIALDLADLPLQAVRRIPLTTWFRFRRAVEHTPTVLFVLERHAIAGSCSSLRLQLGLRGQYSAQNSDPSHAQLLTGHNITAETIRSRHDRKPAGSVAFEAKTAWAG